MKMEEAKLFYTGEMDYRTAHVMDVLNPALRIDIIEVSGNLCGPKCRVTGANGMIMGDMIYRWSQLEFVR